jgi:hypothetical protein
MSELRGLPGVKGALSCQHVDSVDQALRRIQKRRAVTSAGANGALNIWRDDKRQLRSVFCRYRRTLDVVEHADLESLRVWLDKWWPELGRDDIEADVVAPQEQP